MFRARPQAPAGHYFPIEKATGGSGRVEQFSGEGVLQSGLLRLWFCIILPPLCFKCDGKARLFPSPVYGRFCYGGRAGSIFRRLPGRQGIPDLAIGCPTESLSGEAGS